MISVEPRATARAKLEEKKMETLTLPARKSSKNSKVDFTACLNPYTRVAGIAVITTDRAAVSYVVEETPSDRSNWRTFILSKMGGTGTDAAEPFHCVNVRPENIGVVDVVGGCSCKGFRYHHTCKHIDAVCKLITEAKL